MHYNAYFPGHASRDAGAALRGWRRIRRQDPGDRRTAGEDISVFLALGSRAELDERKRMGIKVILFLLQLLACSTSSSGVFGPRSTLNGPQ